MKLIVKMQNLFRSENGQGMVEYGLIIGFIAIVVVAALTTVGPPISAIFTNIGAEFVKAVPAPGGG